MAHSEKVHPHRGHKVHPAHTVKGVTHHSKMNHYPTSQSHSGYSTTEPLQMGGEPEACEGIAGCMPGGGASPMDGAPMGGAPVEG